MPSATAVTLLRTLVFCVLERNGGTRQRRKEEERVIWQFEVVWGGTGCVEVGGYSGTRTRDGDRLEEADARGIFFLKQGWLQKKCYRAESSAGRIPTGLHCFRRRLIISYVQ